MNPNRSKLDLSSPAHNDMIQKLCYFRPGDATDSFDGLTRLTYPWLMDESIRISQTQSIVNAFRNSKKRSHFQPSFLLFEFAALAAQQTELPSLRLNSQLNHQLPLNQDQGVHSVELPFAREPQVGILLAQLI